TFSQSLLSAISHQM
ncbi:urocanase family protein, partial [Vibrio parahaemolyticus V-223/04]